MKFSILGLCLLALASCTSDPPDPSTTTSSLLVSKDEIVLTPASPLDSATVKLSCGCGFNLAIEHFEAEFDAIKYSTNKLKDPQAITYSIVFQPSGNVPNGTYTGKLALLSTGAKGNYRDTIQVSYVKN